MIELTQQDRGDWRIVSARGRADALTSDQLESTLNAAFEHSRQVAADLSGLDYISSCGIRALLHAARTAQDRRARFAVCGMSAAVRKVFEISHLHQILEISGELPC